MSHDEFIGITADLGICGCGSPEEAYEAIHKILLSLRAKNWDEWLNVIDGNIFALITVYMLDANGYLEHGGSICHPWLTSKGEKLMEALDILKEYSYDFGEAENIICIDSIDKWRRLV